MVLGGPWASLGVPGGTKDGGASRGASWDGPGKPLGFVGRYGAILVSVPRDQNVPIPNDLKPFLIWYFCC